MQNLSGGTKNELPAKKGATVAKIFVRMYTHEYYQALGHFVTLFTDIECGLQQALWQISKVKSPVAQAIFSGVRADDACNKITRISEAENWSKERQTEWSIISSRVGILRITSDIISGIGNILSPIKT